MPKQRLDPTLQRALDESNRAYEDGDTHWFDFLASDATVYANASTDAFKGRDAYRKHFEPILKRSKRKVNNLALDAQVLGDHAVIAQTNQIVENDVTVNVRQTQVWRREEDRWQMEHIHTAMIGTPTIERQPKGLSAVRVLNERIATVAAVLGVAQ